MARLVIAEKPSIARAVAEAAGARTRSGDTLRGGGYVVCWARGHIVDMASPDEYGGEGWDGPWSMDALPMLPDRFKWRPSAEDGAEGLFREIAALLASPEVTEVVHAGDPDREGEGIVRRILDLAGNSKPVLRLWCSSAEPAALRDALGAMRPDSDYDGLAAAAEGRAEADWLVGMNATRALTCLYGPLVNAGRVTTALLRIVADRTRANSSFERVPFWTVRATAGGETFETGRFGSERDARAALEAVEGAALNIARVERRVARTAPPRPYSLTDMQRDASRLLGLSAERSLAAAQALYEAGLQTYPRTDSTAISSAELPALRAMLSAGSLEALAGAGPARALRSEENRLAAVPERIVDDSAVSGHPALVPTRTATPEAVRALGADAEAVSRLVAVRTLCSMLGEPLVREKVTAEATAAGVGLGLSAAAVTSPGWTAVRDAAFPPKTPPRTTRVGLAEGSALPVASAELHQGETEPPALYTDDTLLAAMEHADRLVGDPSLKAALASTDSHSGGIGTPATRTPSIARLIALGYIERAGGSLRATGRGLWADSLAPAELASPELTARWEAELDRVESGELPLADFQDSMRRQAASIVEAARAGFDPSLRREAGREPLGPCPRCGKPMVRSRSGRSVYCTSAVFGRSPDGSVEVVDEGCGYRLGPVCGRAMTDGQVRKLLSTGRTRMSGLKSKSGSTFSATVIATPDGEWPTRLEYDAPPPSRRGGARTPGRRGRR